MKLPRLDRYINLIYVNCSKFVNANRFRISIIDVIFWKYVTVQLYWVQYVTPFHLRPYYLTSNLLTCHGDYAPHCPTLPYIALQSRTLIIIICRQIDSAPTAAILAVISRSYHKCHTV